MTAQVDILFYPRYEISYGRYPEVLANNFKTQQTRTIPFGLSFRKIGYHIHNVLTSLGYQTRYRSIYEPYETHIRNFILAKNLVTSSVSNQMIYWDNALRNFLSLTSNKIFYGVIEGPIINPPSNCTIIVPSKYVAYECELANLHYDGIIPHGFDLLQFRVSPLSDKQGNHLQDFHQTKTIFYCLGKYYKRKGFERLFEAVRKVKDEIKGNNFLVYLRTSYRSHYKKILQGLEDVVIIDDTFNVPDSAIVSEMSKCDCYLVSSLAEGFCLPALEAAFGCGKPVIYPDTSPYTDYLDNQIGYPVSIIDEKIAEVPDPEHPMINYFRFKYWDTDEFAKSMIRVIENPTETKLKGAEAYRRRIDWTIYNTYKHLGDYIRI
jgi:glycosyltransferase involved in cell wall biosynthesis